MIFNTHYAMVKRYVGCSLESNGNDVDFGYTVYRQIAIDWGDGTTYEYAYDADEIRIGRVQHSYDSPGTYIITIYGSSSVSLCYDIATKLDTSITKILTPVQVWMSGSYNTSSIHAGGCSELVSVPSDMFVNLKEWKSTMAGMFRDCRKLTSIPSDLFEPIPNCESFKDCFSGCTSLANIPEGLFDNAINSDNFARCFSGCTSITSIPESLFQNTKIGYEYFNSCFRDCTSLTSIPPKLFDRFYEDGGAINHLEECFYNCVSLTGEAPPILWSRLGMTHGEDCFYGCVNLSNYDDIPLFWK